jgi:hypothetical protein
MQAAGSARRPSREHCYFELTTFMFVTDTSFSKRRKHVKAKEPQMVDMQLLNGVLVALAVLVGAAITLSIAIMAAAAVTQRGHARPGGPGGPGEASRELPRHSAAETGAAGIDAQIAIVLLFKCSFSNFYFVICLNQ